MVTISSVRMLIPDRDEHFTDEEIQAFIDLAVNAKETMNDPTLILFYAVYQASSTWYNELKLTDASVKQNSLSVGETAASKEKLLDLYNAAQKRYIDARDAYESDDIDISYPPYTVGEDDCS
jgi:hypothetical protein